MLTLIEGSNEKRDVQQRFEANLKRVLPSQGIWNIGFPGGNADHDLYSKGAGHLWFAPSGPSRENRIPRYWNSFGIYDPNAGAQTITFEANIPARTNTGWVAGFFAKDPFTGARYLMHSGKIGGGGKDVGKTAFLAWANPPLVDVALGDDRYRSGIVVCNLEAPDLVDRVWTLVQKVAEFKFAAKAGILDTREFKARLTLYKDYSREFSGRKQGKRRVEIDYVTYHGDVVEAIAADRRLTLQKNHRIVKNVRIDLGVAAGNDLLELYEVKTSCDRQSLYAALGQIVTHAAVRRPDLERFLVVPADEKPPRDIRDAIQALGIKIRTFRRERSDRGMKIILR